MKDTKVNKVNEVNEVNEISKVNTVKKLQNNRRTRKIVGFTVLLIVLCSLIYGGVWFMASYEPDTFSLIAMQSTDKVTVNDMDDYIAFLPISSTTSPGLLYYPGAKVEPEAYAVMAHQLAETGIPVIIVKMPFNFAVFDSEKAMALKLTLGIADTWAIGGHSLGGAMAAKVVYENPDAFDALILFASYPAGKSNDLSTSELDILSISGSNDGLVTQAKLEAKKPFLPNQTLYYEIVGGNHAQFGSYGPQKGDNLAKITAEEQMNQIVEVVIAFMGGLK